MKGRLDSGLIVAGLIVALIVLELFLGLIGRPEPVQPYVMEVRPYVAEDGHTLVRYSYIPHYSFLRGVSWYDRVVERYVLFGGKFVLTQEVVHKYHYPLFGLGDSWVEEIVLFGKKVEFVGGQ